MANGVLQPQPNPWNPRLFRVVPWQPRRERLRWNLLIGLRYRATILLYTPRALLYGLMHPKIELLGDHDFEERFDNTVFNKMVVPCDGDDPNHPKAHECAPLATRMVERLFPEQLQRSRASKTRLFLADFSIFEELDTFPGTYAAGTTVLFERSALGARLELLAIHIKGMVLEPGDGDAWELAKLFVLQAASIRLVFATHALLHFPEDSINAISKTALPRDHVLFQLLEPHLDLQLVLNHKVQTSRTSPLMNNQKLWWTPHTGPVAGLIRSVEQVYLGVEGNPAYPTYSFKHPRRTPDEKYLNFLEAYYQTILRFVQRVLAHVEPGDPAVMAWADQIAANVPGFPGGAEIFVTPDRPGYVRNLDWAVATFIWDVSVGHTADHYNMGLLDINQNPMRIRVPPPERKDDRFDRRKLRRWADFARYRLFWKMFLRSTTILRLDKVRYPFTDPELQRLGRQFIDELRETEAALASNEFVPLRAIARSIQF